jgi:hypothetical protein
MKREFPLATLAGRLAGSAVRAATPLRRRDSFAQIPSKRESDLSGRSGEAHRGEARLATAAVFAGPRHYVAS